jgi:uncharacterized protein (DUF433 family)
MVDRDEAPTMRQRSLRLPAATLEALDRLAAERGQSANALASRLIEQGLRTERHPLISFRDGEAGRRPALLGSRLDVWQVVDIVRENGGSVAEAAQHLGQPEIKIQAALRYYAEYREEVDAWAQRMREIADAEERAFSASASRPA